MAAILDFTMAANVTKLKMCPVHFVDLKNICLDTEFMFLLYLEADMKINIFVWGTELQM